MDQFTSNCSEEKNLRHLNSVEIKKPFTIKLYVILAITKNICTGDTEMFKIKLFDFKKPNFDANFAFLRLQ